VNALTNDADGGAGGVGRLMMLFCWLVLRWKLQYVNASPTMNSPAQNESGLEVGDPILSYQLLQAYGHLPTLDAIVQSTDCGRSIHLMPKS
jgi:hypothetical protein